MATIKKPNKLNWLTTIFLWTLISILWQIPAYYFLNQKVSQVINPNSVNPLFSLNSQNGLNKLTNAVAKETDFSLASSDISEPSASYKDQYLAFRSGSSLDIYDFNLEKVIWKQTAYPSGKILAYQWLPDRDSLLLFLSGIGSDPEKPHSKTVTVHSIELDSSTAQVSDRFAAVLPLTLQTAKITDISLSTATNLLYFCAERGNRSSLYQIDVMKNLTLLSQNGEDIKHLAISHDTGTVYFNSSTSSAHQIMALNRNKKVQVASNPKDIILGLWNHKLYIGTVEGENLVKIWTTEDNQPSTIYPNFGLYWEGKIPWNSSSEMTMTGYDLLISSENQLYKITFKGTNTLSHNTGITLFSQSGNYYYQITDSATNAVIKRFKVG